MSLADPLQNNAQDPIITLMKEDWQAKTTGSIQTKYWAR